MNEQGVLGMRVLTCLLLLSFALSAGAPSSVSRAADEPSQFVTASTFSEPSYKASPGRAAMPSRVITVSILNDTVAPVRPGRIAALTRAVFAEYKRELNIEFQIIESLPYRGDLTLFPLDQAFLLQRLHARGEIRIVFSNRN